MVYDCIIIGAGPAGLSAAINLISRGKKPMVFSGATNLLAKAQEVNNYLGMNNITGKQMMADFTRHAKAQGVEVISQRIANVMPAGNDFFANAGADVYQGKSVIIACGVAKAKPVHLEDDFLGKGVSYCATCDGALYKGKNVVVWGLAQNASEEAEFLHSIGVNVTYVAAKCPNAIAEKEIPFIKGSLKAIVGDKKVSSVVLADESELSVDGIFILRDAIAPDKLLPGLAIDDGFVVVDRKMATNITGCYACGDCTGLPLQVSKAVGEGLVAGLCVSEFLDKQA